MTAGDHLLGTPSEAAGGVCSPCSPKAVEGRVWASASSGQRPRKPVRDHRGPPAVTEHLPCGAVLGWCGRTASVPSPGPGSRAHPSCFAEFPQESRHRQVSGGGGAAGSRRGLRGEGPLQGRAPWPLRHFLVSSRRLSSLPPHPTPAPHILPAASPLRPVLPASWQPLCPSRDPVFPGRWCPGRLRPSPLPGTLGGLASAASGLSDRPGLCPQPSLSAHSPQVCVPWVLVAAIPGPLHPGCFYLSPV